MQTPLVLLNKNFTNENIIDVFPWITTRFITGNSMDAAMEVGYLESVTEKQTDIAKQLETATGSQRKNLTDQYNNLAEQKGPEHCVCTNEQTMLLVF
ncbi:MAG: hypothetical protein CM15mV68_380 [uncultured marine virus]|nr:MAG: hypothetical protein CM15mV68_380 [uncultured marine virus]